MEDFSKQIREGMQVVSADGNSLGKVSQVWYGSSVGGPAAGEEETCMEIHMRHGLLRREDLFIPIHAIAAVDGDRVMLKVDEQAVRETPSFHRRPAWIS